MALFSGWFTILIYLFVVVAFVSVLARLMTNGAIRHEFALAKAKWERDNGRDYPFVLAELVELWRRKRGILTLRLWRNAAVSGLLLMGCGAALEQARSQEFGVMPGSTSFAWIWQVAGVVAVVAALYFAYRAFVTSRRPATLTLMAELESEMASGQA